MSHSYQGKDRLGVEAMQPDMADTSMVCNGEPILDTSTTVAADSNTASPSNGTPLFDLYGGSTQFATASFSFNGSTTAAGSSMVTNAALIGDRSASLASTSHHLNNSITIGGNFIGPPGTAPFAPIVNQTHNSMTQVGFSAPPNGVVNGWQDSPFASQPHNGAVVAFSATNGIPTYANRAAPFSTTNGTVANNRGSSIVSVPMNTNGTASAPSPAAASAPFSTVNGAHVDSHYASIDGVPMNGTRSAPSLVAPATPYSATNGAHADSRCASIGGFVPMIGNGSAPTLVAPAAPFSAANGALVDSRHASFVGMPTNGNGAVSVSSLAAATAPFSATNGAPVDSRHASFVSMPTNGNGAASVSSLAAAAAPFSATNGAPVDSRPSSFVSMPMIGNEAGSAPSIGAAAAPFSTVNGAPADGRPASFVGMPANDNGAVSAPSLATIAAQYSATNGTVVVSRPASFIGGATDDNGDVSAPSIGAAAAPLPTANAAGTFSETGGTHVDDSAALLQQDQFQIYSVAESTAIKRIAEEMSVLFPVGNLFWNNHVDLKEQISQYGAMHGFTIRTYGKGFDCSKADYNPAKREALTKNKQATAETERRNKGSNCSGCGFRIAYAVVNGKSNQKGAPKEAPEGAVFIVSANYIRSVCVCSLYPIGINGRPFSRTTQLWNSGKL